MAYNAKHPYEPDWQFHEGYGQTWTHVYDDLTLDGRSLKGSIYGSRDAQRRISVGRFIQAQVKLACKTESPMLGNPEGTASLWLLEWVFTFAQDFQIN